MLGDDPKDVQYEPTEEFEISTLDVDHKRARVANNNNGYNACPTSKPNPKVSMMSCIDFVFNCLACYEHLFIVCNMFSCKFWILFSLCSACSSSI